MICGFGIYCGDISRTYTDDRYLDEIPEELREIGETMAMEDYIQHGATKRGHDHVKVNVFGYQQ